MKENIRVIIAIVVIELLIGSIGGMIGFMQGYNKANADQAMWECTTKYSRVALNEISGECVKYFYTK